MATKNADIKGITIEIGGNTSPLVKALDSVKSKSNDIQADLRAVNQLLKFDPSNTEAVARKQELLSAALENSKEKLNLLKKAQVEVEAQFKKGDMGETEYRAFQNRVTYAEADVKKAEKAIDDFGDECKKSGKEAKEAGEDSETAGKKAKKSGDDAKEGSNGWEKFGNLAKNAGKVAVIGITAVTTASVAAGKAVWDMAKDVSDAGGEIDDAAKKVGTTAEEYQKWTYAAKLGGMETSKLDALMVKQQKSFADAKDGSKAMSEAYQRLGVDISKIGSSGEAFDIVVGKLADMEDETTRNALANDIFGKSYADLAPLLAEGSEGIKAWKQECVDLGGVMSNTAVEAGAQFGDSLDRLSTATDGAKNNLISGLLPGLTQVTDGFTGLITEQDGAAKKIERGISSMVIAFEDAAPKILTIAETAIKSLLDIAPVILTTIVSVLLDSTPTLIDSAIQVLQSVLDSIAGNICLITDVLMTLITSAVSFITNNLTPFLNAGIEIIISLINGIANATPQIIQSIVDMIPKLVQAVTDNLPSLIQAGISLLLALTDGLIDAIPQLLAALPEIIDSLLNGLLSAIPQLIQAGIKLITSLVTNLDEIIEKIVAVLPQIINSIINALLENIPLIIQAGVDLLISLIKNLPKIISTIITAAPKIINSVIDALIGNIDKIILAGVQLFVALIKNTPKIISEVIKAVPKIISSLVKAFSSNKNKIADTGLNLIKGLWNGIKDAEKWLMDKITGFFGGVVDRIRDFFGIHSPSTLMRDFIGRNIIKGVGVGVELETPNLSDNIEKNLSDVTAGLQTSLDVNIPNILGSVEKNFSNATAGIQTVFGNQDLNKASGNDSLSAVNLGGITIHIDKFNNSSNDDIHQLTERIMETADEFIRRKQGVFA